MDYTKCLDLLPRELLHEPMLKNGLDPNFVNVMKRARQQSSLRDPNYATGGTRGRQLGEPGGGNWGNPGAATVGTQKVRKGESYSAKPSEGTTRELST